MKIFPFLIFLLSVNSFAKIIQAEGKFYFQVSGKQVPISLLNTLIENREVTRVTLFRGGNIPLISFSKNNEKEKLYSVDKKGFIYSIGPFSSYHMHDVGADGTFSFREFPEKKFRVSSEGLFILTKSGIKKR